MIRVVSTRIDCRGMYDPLPIVLMRRSLDNMRVGDTLEMISDDPASRSDMRAWANLTGHKLLEVYRRGDEFSFYVQKMR